MYKIQQKETGLFSSGGDTPQFTKNGKIWGMRSHVVLHLMNLYRGLNYRCSNCEVVEYEMVEKSRMPIEVFAREAADRKAKLTEYRRNQQKSRDIEDVQEAIQNLKNELKEKEDKLQKLTA
ncbi:MAG: hypothetical protein WC554_07285 [Clostridia bacterium]|jgi:hypothetical protein